jgi:PhnB protein
MGAPISHTPSGYHTITAYLVVHDAVAALDFYREAFGAVEVMRFKGPDGRILHAEMTLGDSRFMLADECQTVRSPRAYSGTTVSLHVYVPDVDAAFDRAVAVGVKVLRPVEDQFYGARSGTLEDPFGHIWSLATHQENISPEEMERRVAKLFAGG